MQSDHGVTFLLFPFSFIRFPPGSRKASQCLFPEMNSGTQALPARQRGWVTGRVCSARWRHRGPERSQVRSIFPKRSVYSEVPFQPWAAELHAERRAKGGAYDPHTRCKPSGVARMFHTPYGMEFLDLGDEMLFINVGAPHSWRRIWVDGRTFPEDIEPGWYGYSIGRWEDDTLVVETRGFNTGFWMSRGGYPHTEQLKTIEKFSRPSWDRLRYEVTIDDPGAYTQPWTGGWFMTWGDGVEPFDYLCQENNLDPDRMLGIDQ